MHELAHLGHVEMLTPKLDESLKFFVEVVGMQESGRKGQSVYLRAYDDYEHHTLKLTAAKEPGIGHFAFRTWNKPALERRAKALKDAGVPTRWTEGDLGHGPALLTETPDGHKLELYYETERYAPPPALKPALKNQAQRFPARGVNVRRLDHLNLLANQVEPMEPFFTSLLGMRVTEKIQQDDGSLAGLWVTATNKSYDLAIARDHTGARGRFHHVTYAVDSREEVLRAADIFLEHGVFIETGPHKHAIQQTFFLYVYEPGGNRFEIANAGARLILAPDWKPVV
ncbi:MAG TPA: VOC family protein, partial [Xanthobacteraceae bacterium]|nr:VOC family protein [Xanthobacteraceae bacterium]